VVAGKPYAPIVEVVRSRYGDVGTMSATGPTPTVGSPGRWVGASLWC